MNYFTDKQILEYIMQKFIDNKWSHVIINNLIKKKPDNIKFDENQFLLDLVT